MLTFMVYEKLNSPLWVFWQDSNIDTCTCSMSSHSSKSPYSLVMRKTHDRLLERDQCHFKLSIKGCHYKRQWSRDIGKGQVIFSSKKNYSIIFNRPEITKNVALPQGYQ